MKRFCLLLISALCLLLTACAGGSAQNEFEAFSAELSARSELVFTAELTAIYEDKNVDFTLAYEKSGDDCVVTVLEPKMVQGIRARISGGGTAVEYEGIMLDTGRLDDYGLSPMTALPMLVEAMCSAHADSFWEDGGLNAVKLLPSDTLSAVVWFDGGVPVSAELISEGRVTVSCVIKDWR